jgi:hypothetical protein
VDVEAKKDDSGTWFLSYLCSAGIIKNDDSVWCNYVVGKLLKPLGDIPAGFHVEITMENSRIMTVHYATEKQIRRYEASEDGEDGWWEAKCCQKKNFTVTCSFESV